MRRCLTRIRSVSAHLRVLHEQRCLAMDTSFQELLSSYVERYPQEVRDLAETFCASTTRLGHHMVTQPMALTGEVKAQALQRGLDVELVANAVADYSAIEARAESMHKASRS